MRLHPSRDREMSRSVTGRPGFVLQMLQNKIFQQQPNPLSRPVTGRPVFSSQVLQIEIFQRQATFRLDL